MLPSKYSRELSAPFDRARRCFVLLVSLPILLGGCSTIRQISPKTFTQTAVENVDPASITASALERNPYLAGRELVPEGARKQFEKSKLAMQKGDWNSALQQLQRLVDEYPKLSGPCLNLALAYQQLDDKEHAEYWFKQSIARNNSNLLAYNQYGIFLRGQGRFEQAEKIYLAALDIWEPHADTHRNIGILYDLYRGDKKSAVQHYYRYQALQDKDDRVVAGWIVDLERQLNSAAEGK